ncbi:hypothetical protein CQA58_00280 [Helicobacter brantae]|uniref:Autotransporter domain-containing protein n=1 Tax=Helicobacter brantae TaxID=375927 RepID=A0A3D8J4D7_9HELI|nr:hypothetical protein CQA58_00280 [Helicobacter brantae]
MRFNRYIAFSIVASSVLCGASYQNWNGGNLNGGDIVNITNDFKNTNPTILNSDLTINGGTVSANITSDSRQQLNGLVANFTSGNITFGGNGTIDFNVNVQGSVGQPSFFNLSGNTSLTISSGISITSSGQAVSGGIFRAQNGASLTFSGDTTINGNGNTAITMGSGALSINSSGGKNVQISGNINAGSGTSTIKLDSQDKITGTYTGSGNLTLDIDASTYAGSVTNNGTNSTSTINITNRGQLQGTLTTQGQKLNLTMNNGSITQSVNSTAQNNTATLTSSTITNNASFNGSGTNNVTMSGGSIGGKLTAGNGTNTIEIKDSARVNGGFDADGTTMLTMDSGTIGGTSNIQGTSFTAELKDKSNLGTLTSSASTNDFKSDSSTITSLTLNGTTKNEASLTNTNVTNGVSLQGGNNSVTMNGGSIGGKLTTKGGGTNNVTIQSNASISGGFDADGTTTLTVDNGTINGTSNISGTRFQAILTGTNTLGDLNSTATTNIFNASGTTANNLSFSGTNHSIQLVSSNINNTLTTQSNGGLASITSTDSTINKIVHSDSKFQAILYGNTTITQGITVNSGTQAVVQANGNSQINGASTFSANVNQVGFYGTSGGGDFVFNGTTQNNLLAYGTNTIQSATMTGAINQIGVMTTTASLVIQGDATLTATTRNTVKLDNGTINGTLTTQGLTSVSSGQAGNATINGGIRHSDGNLTAIFNQNSKISNGIQTTGGIGTALVNLNNTTTLSGDSSFANQTNKINLYNSSQVNGNITFAGGTSTLTANSDSAITGQIISGAGTGTTDLTINQNATITGGIDTQAGAGKTTANFTTDSKLQSGTSTFHSDIDITFANTSKAISETFNVAQGTANIKFQDNAEMQGGSINNNGGDANITFTNSSKMTNGTISTASGDTTLTADTSANLTGTLTQSGGTFNATFKDDSQFNGNATQSGGDSTITFKDNAKWTGNFDQSNGASNITFHGIANMQGNITTTNGTTNISFDNQAYIVGDIKAQGTKNDVTFNNSLLKGNLTLDGLGDIMGNSKGDFTNSRITGKVTGYDEVEFNLTTSEVQGQIYQGPSVNNSGMTGDFKSSQILGGFVGERSINNLTLTNSKIANGIQQKSGKLTLTATESIITGGFEGTQNSENDITMTKGSLSGGIKQTTGGLDFLSEGTTIEGGFQGTSSTNTLKMLDGNFNNGDITQSGGSLKADIVSMQNIGSFNGTNNSQNVIHLMDTTIANVSQNSGSLEFRTNAEVTGNIQGTGNSTNNISVTGANVGGTISQNTGSMDLYLTNAKVTSTNTSISATNADFGLYANTAVVEGGITLTSSNTSGVSNALTLKGEFNQTNGASNLTFANSTFEGDISITSATSASMIFTKSEIKNIQANNGSTSFNLTNSKMGDFSGNRGTHSVTLTDSDAGTFTQTNGRELTINATSGSTTQSITSNFSTLSISLNNSRVEGNISNNGENTTISSQNSTITGDVTQRASSMNFNASDTQVEGKYKQTDGVSMVNFTNSSIGQGIDFTTVQSGTLSFAQNSRITGGFTSSDSRFSFMLLSNSTLKGGFTQTQGSVTGTLDGGSSISGGNGTAGLTLSSGSTTLSLFNSSKIENGITATDHTTTILVDGSKIDGNMTITGGSFDLTAQNNSTITSPQMQVQNAHLKLTLDTTSKFEGSLEQTNNNQEITIKQNSTFTGNITNTNTNSIIHIQTGGKLEGSLEQTNGSLKLDLSNDGNITNDVTLSGVTTTLSGSGTDNSIGGNFSQTNGSVTGSMNGLTLTGTYTQDGGTSSVSFTNSAFQNNTTITDATSSSLTFDHSILKAYTISGGDDNTLKLLNDTTMTGNLTLKNTATATLKMDSSTIEGNIDAQNNSTLNFNTLNSQVTGTTTIDTGGLTGIADSTSFGGDFTLTDTTSNVSFTNGSTINGDVTATGTNSNNTIKFDNSSITGNLSQTDGEISLDLSNGSSIGGDLTFKDTNAHFTGSGAGNSIGGNFLSKNSTLTGDVSGLTLTGTFTQENGTSNITFRNNSNFNGEVTIKDATSSNLNFTNQSGINNTLTITNGNNNAVNLSDNSFINGATTITGATATITGSNGSSITGNLSADNSTTTLSLTGSSFNGSITQNQGTMNLTGTNGSSFTTQGVTINGNGTTATTNVNLDTNSTLTGNITADSSTLTFNLNNNSSLGEAGNPSDINLTNSTLSITASNGSSFNANITDNNNTNTQPLKTATLGFSSGSVYNGKMNFSNIDTTATFTGSTLNSEEMTIAGGSFTLKYDSSPNGGVISKLTATNTKLDITATGGSRAFINELSTTDSTLDLLAENNARLMANVTLQGNTTATYTALTNGNLNVNTTIASQASTLDVNLSGGMLQGSFTQTGNGAGGFSVGDVVLESVGNFGGRLAITDDSQLKSLSLSNDEQILYTNALFASAFSNPMSYVDFTLEFDDTATTSRVGKEMIVKPNPINGQPIPDAPNGQTYVRQLQVNTLSGNNGLFRVYADLGAGLADNILAQKASGDHLIQVQYRAETFQEIGGQRIVVAKVTDPTTSVSFKGTQSEVGLTRYDTEILKENSADGQGFEWIIGQATPSGISYSSKIIASMIQSQYRNFSVEIDSLDRRLGDLKYIQRDLGVWMRGYVGQGSQEARDFSVASKDNYYSVWAGVDFNSLGLTVHNFAGAFFNYTAINTESKDYTAKGYNVAFGIYNTFKAFSGFYADVLAKYIYSSNSFEISNYSLAKNSPSISNHKLLLNAEIGYSFYYGEKNKSGYIEPQFQVTSGYIDKSTLEVVDVSGETISATMARNFPVNIRAGVFWGQVFGEKIKSHIKVGSSFAYDVNSGGDLSFKDSSTELSYKQDGDFRMILSAQTDFTFNDFFKLYASLDTSFFGDYNVVYSANVGLRMTFGRANNRVRNVPMVYNPYTPPVAINDDKRTVPVVKRYTTKDIDQNYAGKPRKIESYIEGNQLPTRTPNGIGGYSSQSRQSVRDITSEVSF